MTEPMTVGRRRPLHADDVPALIRRWQDDRDDAARLELVRRFTPLVRGLARRYRNSHDSMDDLVQVASLGLIGAIERFDPDRGSAFKAYATPTILGELKRYFRGTGWAAHVPRRAQELALLVERTGRDLSVELGRSPRVDEVAKALRLDVEDVLAGLDAATAHFALSLDAPAPGARGDGEEPATLIDQLGRDDESLDLVDATDAVARAMRHLPHAERHALRLRVEDGLRQVDIAERMGCSQMQVSRLLRRASVRVREMVAGEGSAVIAPR